MSLTTEQSQGPVEGSGERESCAQCGAPLAADQEWCLECGAARTLVHKPPDWRIPIAIVGGVVALVLAGFAIALINLSGNANRSAQALATAGPATSSQPAATTTTAATTAAPALAPVSGWPFGVSGWTVELATRHRHNRALNVARRFIGAGIKAGVLNSSRHPLMTPGSWVVFFGRYPDRFSAAAAATKLRAQGHPRARAVEVAPPGGI